MRKYFLLVLFLMTSIVFLGWIFYGRPAQTPPIQVALPPVFLVAPSSTPAIQASSTTKLKTYRNVDFGFEFGYPPNWKFEENTVYSPFSKFNLIGFPLEGIYISDPIVINIVNPDFAERQFSDLKGTGLITSIAGVTGERYKYSFEGTEEVDIILPFGQYKMILGTKKPYENVFNQILATFKFLK